MLKNLDLSGLKDPDSIIISQKSHCFSQIPNISQCFLKKINYKVF